MRLRAHGVDGSASGFDLLHDIDEVTLLIRILDVVVVVQNQDGTRTMLASELEGLGDPTIRSCFTSPEVRRVFGRGVGRWFVHDVDQPGVRVSRTEGFYPVFDLSQGRRAARLLRAPDERVLLEDDVVGLRVAVHGVERRPIEGAGGRTLNRAPLPGIFWGDLIPVFGELHAAAIDGVASGDVADELAEGRGTGRANRRAARRAGCS